MEPVVPEPVVPEPVVPEPVVPESLVHPGAVSLWDGGPKVGRLAFGCWRFTHADVGRGRDVLGAALDALEPEDGVVLVDTADVYGLDFGGAGFGANETALGNVLAAAPELRDRLVLATKGGIAPGVPYDSSATALRSACEASLRRLGVDVLDLYQVHRPDLFTHPAEVVDTLAGLREDGLIRAWGVSNHTVDQHRALARLAGEGPATSQPELSVVALDAVRDGTLDWCLGAGSRVLAWSPLGGGRVASGDGLPPALLDALDALAAREGVDRATVAIAFVLALPGSPIAIVGSQSPERLAACARATSVTLDRRDCYRLIEASEGVALP